MGEYMAATLDYTLSALAHPTRRQMLEIMEKGPVRVTDLASEFACSLNVASKHILNLERAGLVQRKQQGREHWLELNADPLQEVSAFVQRYRRFWEKQMDNLGLYLDQLAADKAQQKSAKTATVKKGRGETR